MCVHIVNTELASKRVVFTQEIETELGCVSQKRLKPTLIVESIVQRILILRAVPKDIVAKGSLENS